MLMLPRGSYEMPKILKSIKLSVGRRAIAFLREVAPAWLERNLRAADDAQGAEYHFWQPGGGYDRNITHSAVAWAWVDYIPRNPVQRGMVGCETNWAWSSARWYAVMEGVVLAMDDRPPDS